MDTQDFPLDSTTKPEILKALFDCDLIRPSLQTKSHFNYYRKAVESVPEYSIIKTHRHIANIVELLKNSGRTRHAAEAILLERISEHKEERDEILGVSISLAVRLLLMISTGPLTRGRSLTFSDETKLGWKEGTIEYFAADELIPQSVLCEHVILEKSSMRGISRGLRVWRFDGLSSSDER